MQFGPGKIAHEKAHAELALFFWGDEKDNNFAPFGERNWFALQVGQQFFFVRPIHFPRIWVEVVALLIQLKLEESRAVLVRPGKISLITDVT